MEEERRGAHGGPQSCQISPFQSVDSLQLRSGQFYPPPVSESLDNLSPQTLKRAKCHCLPPQQEFVRTAVARALVPPAPQKKLSDFLTKFY